MVLTAYNERGWTSVALHSRAFINAQTGINHRAELGAAYLDTLEWFQYCWWLLLTSPERFDDSYGVLHLIHCCPLLAKLQLPLKDNAEAARHGLIAYADGHYQVITREVELQLLDQAWEAEALQRWREHTQTEAGVFEQ